MHDRSSESYDPLGALLADLTLGGVAYGHCRLRRPWGVACPAEEAARLHFVVAGETWLWLDDIAPVRLGPGDVAFLPRGHAHAMADTPRGPTRPLASFPREPIGEATFRLVAGGDGEETLMACASVAIGPAAHPVLELMPRVLVLRNATTRDPLLAPLLDAMASEVVDGRAGKPTMMARLADLVVARIVRAWSEERAEGERGWLAALRDPNVARTLSQLHRDPGKSWSIEALARTAGLSRSVFAERFVATMGVSPAAYVAKLRMHLASSLLRDGRHTIGEVSQRLGYESEASFSRAFKRVVGVPPSGMRRACACAG